MTTVTKDKTLDDIIDSVTGDLAIVLYNDDVNSFQHVIICLVSFCGHAPTQAEQCAMIVHHNGKYAVKHGSREKLEPILEALLENELSAKIEPV